MTKQRRCKTEGDRVMGKETIIFFENLGFGWVFDPTNLTQMDFESFSEETVINSSLMKIIENILSDNQRF
jgi:hypothetical protein